MKIIEAMKQIKMNDEKIADLQEKINRSAAHTSLERPVYGDETRDKVRGWLQACTDLTQESVSLLCAIQKTNMATDVSIELGGKKVTKTIAEWVWRRRRYASVDRTTWSQLNDRDLEEGQLSTSNNTDPLLVTIVRHYDPSKRDDMIEMFREEPHRIDSALEIVNATTELVV